MNSNLHERKAPDRSGAFSLPHDYLFRHVAFNKLHDRFFEIIR